MVAVSVVVTNARSLAALCALCAWTARARADAPDAPTTTSATAAPAPAAPASAAPATAAPTPAPAPARDPDGEVKLSLPTESDRVAWTRPGFRLGLAISYGELVGLRGAPSGRLLGVAVHAGLRLDSDWSLLMSFDYARASSRAGISGLRFAGTLDPTWHVTRALSLALGMGFAGIVEGHTNRPDVNPLPGTLDSSYTFPDARTPLPQCSGVGVAGLARAQYAWVLGPRAATQLELEVIAQYTQCVDPTGRTEPDTAQPIVRIQYWPLTGATLSWGFTWR